VEYVYPIPEDIEFEAGYEGEFFHDDLDYSSEFYDTNELIWIADVSKSNQFLFDQNLHAVYTTFFTEIEDFGILAGLRAEQALITSNLVNVDSVIPNKYFKLFPTIHLSYELSENQQLGVEL
jgi:hypothetical protein